MVTCHTNGNGELAWTESEWPNRDSGGANCTGAKGRFSVSGISGKCKYDDNSDMSYLITCPSSAVTNHAQAAL